MAFEADPQISVPAGMWSSLRFKAASLAANSSRDLRKDSFSLTVRAWLIKAGDRCAKPGAALRSSRAPACPKGWAIKAAAASNSSSMAGRGSSPPPPPSSKAAAAAKSSSNSIARFRSKTDDPHCSTTHCCRRARDFDMSGAGKTMRVRGAYADQSYNWEECCVCTRSRNALPIGYMANPAAVSLATSAACAAMLQQR